MVAMSMVVVVMATSTWVPWASIGVIALGLLVGGLVAFAPRSPVLVRSIGTLQPARPAPFSAIAGRAFRLAERSLRRRGSEDDLAERLERAAIEMRPGEFVVLRAMTVATALAVGLVLMGVLGALVLGTLAVIGFRAVPTWRADRRRAKFGEQLGDTLQLLSGSLRAGYGLLQAVDGVAREAESPTSDEFNRLVVETRLGRTVPEALHGIADRAGNEDFRWVVQAIEINREVGGELTEVLDRVCETIRERDGIRRQIRTLSAEGRLSVKILLVLPLAMMLLQQATNPNYLSDLTGTSTGQLMIAAGVMLLAVGGVWLRKIATIPF
jgi:tight adherence protein B